MTISLTKPAAGSVGWAGAINQNWTDIENYVNARRLPRGYVQGIGLLWAATDQVLVKGGTVRDKDDSIDITLVDTGVTVGGAANPGSCDAKTSAATVTPTASSANATTSASILSELGMRTLSTTTFSSSGTSMTVSGDMKGTVAVNDLVGTDSTYGFARVTAVSYSGTTITLAAALPGGNAPGGTALKLIENPTFGAVTAGENKRFNTISAGGTAIVANSNFGGSPGGSQALQLGVVVPSCWVAVWVGSGSNGSTAFCSTQRSTPFGISSLWTSSVRRVGWVRNNSSGQVMRFHQVLGGSEPMVELRPEVSTENSVVLSGGTATSWTEVLCTEIVPPTSRLAHVNLQVASTGGGATQLRVRPRVFGVNTTDFGNTFIHLNAASDYSNSWGLLGLDDAQALEYKLTTATGSATISVIGYVDRL